MTTSSRMVYAFARDGGLPASGLLTLVHHGMPLNALYLTTSVTLLFGCIFAISSAAFNAISSASIFALSISYALPIAINYAHGRGRLSAGTFTLPPAAAWLVNLIGVSYSILTSILFLLPPKIPANSTNMNYGGMALLLVLMISAMTWIFHSREIYRGPSLLRYDGIPSSDSFETST
jgi:choline transport protein